MKTPFTFRIEAWKTVSEELLQRTNIFELYQRTMRLQSEEHEASFSVLKAPDWINVLALTEHDEVIAKEFFSAVRKRIQIW